MLLALMANLRAIGMRHNAQYNMLRASDARMNMLNSIPSFGSGSMNRMASAEMNMDMEMAKNSTLYQMAVAQEEATNKLLQKEIKRSFSYFA